MFLNGQCSIRKVSTQLGEPDGPAPAVPIIRKINAKELTKNLINHINMLFDLSKYVKKNLIYTRQNNLLFLEIVKKV